MAVLAGISNFHKVPELRRRVIFTLGMLAVYRIGVFVTIPGVDRNAMRQSSPSSRAACSASSTCSPAARRNLSIFALGIMPYISASIILQLVGMVYKPIDELRERGRAGPAQARPVHALRHDRALASSSPSASRCSLEGISAGEAASASSSTPASASS